MTPERWQRVKSLVKDCFARSPTEFRAFLENACAGDEPLRCEVESLLTYRVAAVRFLERSVSEHLERELGPFQPGDRVGPYSIVGEIAFGGTSRVYQVARRDRPHERFALKVLRRGHVSKEAVRRFEIERQILGRLSHPHVARLHDGGLTTDGRPYLVLEWVTGQPIDSYCEERKLMIPARLELFRKVCCAVDAVHEMGVIHRDLKPANVLVGDDDGEPKLIDFGIAAFVNAGTRTREGRANIRGSRPVTLGYCSPELLLEEPASTACDVYSLGVILHELVTGRRPDLFPGEPPAQLTTAICELHAVGNGAIADILARALHRNPKARYRTPRLLSEDIERVLRGLELGPRVADHRSASEAG